MKSKLFNTFLVTNIIFVVYSLIPCTHSAVSINSVNVRQGVKEFLHKCTNTSGQNSTMDDSVLKAAVLCIENGLAQVSGRRFRSKEDVPNMCRAVSSVIHCLQPLKDDIQKCSSTEEAALLDLLDDLCKDGGVKITDFQPGFECLQQNRKIHKTCLERIDDGEKYTQNLQKTLRNPCDALSILVECTREVLPACQTKTPEEQLKRFLTELDTSNPDAYRCTTRRMTSAKVDTDTVIVASTDISSSLANSLCLQHSYFSVMFWAMFSSVQVLHTQL